MMNSLKHLLNRFITNSTATKLDVIKYWEDRVARYGARSVLNLGFNEDQFESKTHEQRRILLPLLTSLLNGNEKLILDFGCGPGRFTSELANLINGRAIGIDPIQKLLDLAPKQTNVIYQLFDGTISLPSASIDILWICLVLGGIPDQQLNAIVIELNRVLKPGGLLFLVENTSSLPSTGYWNYRSVKDYQQLFPLIELIHQTDYKELEERISILAGRSRTTTTC